MSNKKELTLWDRVSTTDPKYTAEAKIGQRKFTNIDAYYIIKQLTEEFGAYGTDWKLEDINHETVELNADSIMLVSSAFFVYGKDGKFGISTAGLLKYKTSSGYTKIDTDIYKKNETNLISKGASKLGFGADVYMGLFEDAAYVADATEEKIIKEQEDLKRKPITLVHIKKIQSEMIVSGAITLKQIQEKYNIVALKDLTIEQYNNLYGWAKEEFLKKQEKKKKEEAKNDN